MINLEIENNFDLNILTSFPDISKKKYIEIKFKNIENLEYLKILTINLLFHLNFKIIQEENETVLFKNKNFKKVAFHIYFFCVRGTSTAIYDYAHFNESLLNNESIIVVPKSSLSKNIDIALNKFQERFNIFYYDDVVNLDEIIVHEKCDVLYTIKYGTNDGLFSKVVKTCIHCVFDMTQPHGDIYAGVSKQIATKYGKQTFVPHMVIEPNFTCGNLRDELGIPKDGIVFGYHGGSDSFNIQFAINAVKKSSRLFPSVYFIFVNIPKFDINNVNIFFLNKIVEKHEKCKFIKKNGSV